MSADSIAKLEQLLGMNLDTEGRRIREATRLHQEKSDISSPPSTKEEQEAFQRFMNSEEDQTTSGSS